MATTPLSPFYGIIFDLDGTLYVLRWFMKPLIFFRLFPGGMRLPRFLAVREKFAGRDMGDRERLLAAVGGEFGRGERMPAEQAKQWITDRFYPAFVAIMPFFRFSRPFIRRLLGALREKGVRLAVLSDYGCVKERLEKLGLSPTIFDAVSSCEDAGALKPHPRPLLAIAEKWGIAPGQILVLGDRADTDGAAAKNAGMQFIRVADSLLLPQGAMRWGTISRMLLS
ncbi:MAG TPA: HAD family hydrolase [Chitinivibrionales bacterium]|nr:HAD family hydrolase [Chitinivibrionales bacterium]